MTIKTDIEKPKPTRSNTAIATATRKYEEKLNKWEDKAETDTPLLPNRFVVFASEWTSEHQCAWLNRETVEQYRKRMKR